MRTSRPGLSSGTRLFATYAVASLVPVLALGVVLAHGNRQDGVQRGLESARAQAAVIEEMAIAPALSGELLDADGLSSAEERRMQDATDLAIFRGSVVRLRLRAFDGAVVFSDDNSVRGALPAADPDFVAATEGSTRLAGDRRRGHQQHPGGAAGDRRRLGPRGRRAGAGAALRRDRRGGGRGHDPHLPAARRRARRPLRSSSP